MRGYQTIYLTRVVVRIDEIQVPDGLRKEKISVWYYKLEDGGGRMHGSDQYFMQQILVCHSVPRRPWPMLYKSDNSYFTRYH